MFKETKSEYFTNCVSAIDCSEDGKYLAIGVLDDKVIVKNAYDFTTLNTQYVNLGAIDISISGDCSKACKLAVTSFEWLVKIYNIEDPNQVVNIDANPYEAWKCCCDYTGKSLYTGGDGGKVFQYDTETGEMINDYRSKNENFITCITTSEIGDVAFGNSNGDLQMIYPDEDEDGIRMVTCKTDHMKHIRSIAFNHDSSSLISVSDDLQICVYDCNKQKMSTVIDDCHTNKINCLSVNPKDSTFVTASSDNTLKVWDLRSKGAIDTITASNSAPFWSCKFNYDGKSIFAGGENGYFTVFSK